MSIVPIVDLPEHGIRVGHLDYVMQFLKEQLNDLG